MELTGKLKKMLKRTGKNVDLILFNGKPSLTPLVLQLFEQDFGPIVSYTSGDLKRPLVVGALDYLEESEDYKINLQ